MRYLVEDFWVEYGTRSIGWECDVKAKTTPIEKAQSWMNAKAMEGYRLVSLISDRPTRVTVVMGKETD